MAFSISSAPGTKIGSAVTGGTSKSVLFVNAAGNLAQDNTNLQYDSAVGLKLTQLGAGATVVPLTIVQAATGAGDLLDIFASDGTTKKFMVNAGGQVGVAAASVGTNTKLQVNPYVTVDNAVATMLNAGAATNKALVIQSAASQSANPLELQTSTGAVYGGVGVSGSTHYFTMTANSLGMNFNGLITNVRVGSTADVASAIPIAARGAVSQTGDLIQALSNGNAALTRIDAKGRIRPDGQTAHAATDWAAAGFGPGAVVTVTGDDQRGVVTVTTVVADTPTANPTLTLTFKDGTWTTAPFAVANFEDTSTGPAPATGVTNTTTATTLVLKYRGTPTAVSALTYKFNFIILG